MGQLLIDTVLKGEDGESVVHPAGYVFDHDALPESERTRLLRLGAFTTDEPLVLPLDGSVAAYVAPEGEPISRKSYYAGRQDADFADEEALKALTERAEKAEKVNADGAECAKALEEENAKLLKVIEAIGPGSKTELNALSAKDLATWAAYKGVSTEGKDKPAIVDALTK